MLLFCHAYVLNMLALLTVTGVLCHCDPHVCTVLCHHYYRRVNVALTRAKRHLLIVGNRQMLQTNQVWGRIINYCNGE